MQCSSLGGIDETSAGSLAPTLIDIFQVGGRWPLFDSSACSLRCLTSRLCMVVLQGVSGSVGDGAASWDDVCKVGMVPSAPSLSPRQVGAWPDELWFLTNRHEKGDYMQWWWRRRWCW